jgi:hypothetical protein
MPSSLISLRRRPKSVIIGGKKRRFPKRDWKGAGKYYHRGRGKFTRYSLGRDIKKRVNIDRKGSKKRKWRHTHDTQRWGVPKGKV